MNCRWIVLLGAGASLGCASAPASTAAATDAVADAKAAAEVSGADAKPADAADPCKGQTCSGTGKCKVGSDGKAFCDCTAADCRYPTADLRCVSAADLCTEAALACDGGASCAADDDPSGCSCDATHAHKPICRCGNGQALKNGQCTADTAACWSLAKCAPPAAERWHVEVSGAVNLLLADRPNNGTGIQWNSATALVLQNAWPKEFCGALQWKKGAGDLGEFDAAQVDMAFLIGGKTWATNRAGTSGKITVKAADTCGKPGCNKVDLQIDATFGGYDGTDVQLKGFVKGADL